MAKNLRPKIRHSLSCPDLCLMECPSDIVESVITSREDKLRENSLHSTDSLEVEYQSNNVVENVLNCVTNETYDVAHLKEYPDTDSLEDKRATATDATATDATATDATATDATAVDSTATNVTATDATTTNATAIDTTPTDATATDATETDATVTNATATDATATDATATVAATTVVLTTDTTASDVTATDVTATKGTATRPVPAPRAMCIQNGKSDNEQPSRIRSVKREGFYFSDPNDSNQPINDSSSSNAGNIQETNDVNSVHKKNDESGGTTLHKLDGLCSWLDEPLYQMISQEETSKERWTSSSNVQVDGSRPSSAMDFVRQKKSTLWVDVNDVKDLGIVENLSRKEINFQEAKFEILTSEASYLKSLILLKNHFINSSEFATETILTRKDHHVLFSDMKRIRKCSKAFLQDLNKCWRDDVFLPGIFDVIYSHAKENFQVYVNYCTRLNTIQAKLLSLSKSKKFADTLETLQSDEICQGLQLESFLLLPMIRITKLPLPLTKALEMLTINRQSYGPFDFQNERDKCLQALDFVLLVTDKCNREKGTIERMTKMLAFRNMLVFPANYQQVELIRVERWFVHSGEVRKHSWGEMTSSDDGAMSKHKNIMQFKKAKATLTLFLLNDLILVTEKNPKSESSYVVTDHCKLSHVSALSVQVPESKRMFRMRLILRNNHEQKCIEMMLSCNSILERDYWLEKLNQKNDVNKMAPKQMVCAHPFRANDPGHLFLREGDEVTVIRILDNGWMEGVRKRGDKAGIFPPSRVADVIM